MWEFFPATSSFAFNTNVFPKTHFIHLLLFLRLYQRGKRKILVCLTEPRRKPASPVRSTIAPTSAFITVVLTARISSTRRPSKWSLAPSNSLPLRRDCHLLTSRGWSASWQPCWRTLLLENKMSPRVFGSTASFQNKIRQMMKRTWIFAQLGTSSNKRLNLRIQGSTAVVATAATIPQKFWFLDIVRRPQSRSPNATTIRIVCSHLAIQQRMKIFRAITIRVSIISPLVFAKPKPQKEQPHVPTRH